MNKADHTDNNALISVKANPHILSYNFSSHLILMKDWLQNSNSSIIKSIIFFKCYKINTQFLFG